jgi:hypothetical protein
MNRPRIVAALVLFGAVLVPLRAASGEHADSQAVASARLGQEAVKLYEAGSWAAALEKFDAAYALVPSPTLGLYAARCLVKVDRLVEASERYLEITRLELSRNAPKAMLKAQVDAAAEREKLLPTIPSLEILLEGARGSGVDVTVDAKPLLPGLLGEKRRVNPGRYRIEAKRGDATVRKDITLAAGDSARIVLELPPLVAPTPRLPMMRKVGWGAIGVASASVIVGGVAGAVAFAKEQSLLKTCPNYVCQSSADLARAGSYDAARAASVAGFVVGGLALAAGVTLLLVSPKEEYVDTNGHVVPAPKDSAARISPFVGPGGGGLQGTF